LSNPQVFVLRSVRDWGRIPLVAREVTVVALRRLKLIGYVDHSWTKAQLTYRGQEALERYERRSSRASSLVVRTEGKLIMMKTAYVACDTSRFAEPNSSGRYELFENFWWRTDEDGNILFAKLGTRVRPQCNRDERVTQKLHDLYGFADAQIIQVPRVFVPLVTVNGDQEYRLSKDSIVREIV
jgi:hypothetical protein